MRGFARALEPARLPSASIGAVRRWRLGACFRASRQMKNPIPPSTTTAPIAMKIAEPPENALPLPAAGVVLTVGAAVELVVGIETDG